MRVGVNTGEVLVGALRAGGDYTAMGDVVNTANRLQTAAEPGEVVVGPATYAATRRVVRYEPLEPHRRQGPGGAGRGVAWPRARSRRPATGPSATGPASSAASPSSACSCHSVENADPQRTRARCSCCSARPAWASPAWPRSWPSHAECEHDALVLEGRCVPYGEANVWWPVADALRHGCRHPLERPGRRGRRAGPHRRVHRARRGRRRRPRSTGSTRACST